MSHDNRAVFASGDSGACDLIDSIMECEKMTIHGVPVESISVVGGRRNGRRKLFKILDSMKDQNYNSVEECISTVMGCADAVEAKFEEVKE